MNNSNKPLLTISLLSGGKSKYLENCLSSLNSLRSRVPAELIVVDTCMNRQVNEIIKKYTDIIIPFQWINDFSAARNAGLDAARGQWFLFIDDDEFFENTEEIEEFFLSGEYKDYGALYYIVRNYQDYEASSYVDTRVSRCFHINESVRFYSPIHEYPYPMVGREKNVISYAHHYGYVQTDQDIMKEKSQRNIPLLLQVLEQDNQNPRWYCQIIQEYYSAGDHLAVDKYCRDILDRFRSHHDDEAEKAKRSAYMGIIRNHMRNGQIEEAIELYRRAYNDPCMNDMCRAALDDTAAVAYFSTGKMDEAVSCCGNYMQIYGQLQNDILERSIQGGPFINDIFLPKRMIQILCIFISCQIRRGEISSIEGLFQAIPKGNKGAELPDAFLNDMISLFCLTPYRSFYTTIAKEILVSEVSGPSFTSMIKNASSQKEEYAAALRKVLKPNQDHSLSGISATSTSTLSDNPGLSPELMELKAMATQVKASIRKLISLGKKSEAKMCIRQLKNLTPDDPEIQALEAILG